MIVWRRLAAAMAVDDDVIAIKLLQLMDDVNYEHNASDISSINGQEVVNGGPNNDINKSADEMIQS